MKTWICTFRVFIVPVLSAYITVISCGGDGDRPGTSLAEELQALDIDRYIGLVRYSSHAPYIYDTSWEIYQYDTSECKCVRGAPFHIGVKRKTATGNVMILLSGGGACWPGKEACYTETNYETGHDDTAGDVLNGWSVIHVPYCDGSVHTGDNDADYDGDGAADHYHHGLRTTTAAVSIMLELFPDPPKVYIKGISAGGYGTFITYMLVRRFFPRSVICIFNDSGPGLMNPGNTMPELTEYAWHFRQFFPESCSPCSRQMIFFYSWMLDRDPDVRIALFSSYYDSVISDDFLEMEDEDFKDLLLSASGGIAFLYPGRFCRFMIKGDTHTLGNTPGGESYTVNGVSVKSWLDMMITGDTGWKDILE